MATPPNVFGFFAPGRRRRVPPTPAPFGPAASQRLLSAAEEALSGVNAPAQIGENIKEDLKDAFTVKAEARPGFEPGKVSRGQINLLDLVTDPAATVWKTASAPFSTKWSDLIPQPDEAWKTSESAVWDNVFANHVDVLGNQVAPYSFQQAVKRWTEAATSSGRGARIVAEEKGIRENPGLTQMMAVGLANYYAPAPGVPLPTVAGVPLQNIIDSSRQEEELITRALTEAEGALHPTPGTGVKPDYREAMRLWKGAGDRQKAWGGGVLAPASEEVQKEFERLMRTDPAFAASPEAQLWKYWQNRNLHYQTLNFLKTYKKDGVWGAFREYGWGKLSKRFDAFAKIHPRIALLYPPKAIEAIIKKTIGKKLETALNKLTNLQSFIKRKRKAITDIPEKALKKFGERIGLQKLATKLLSRFAFAGGPIGIVIGAVITFFGDELMKALGGPLKVVLIGIAAILGAFMLGITMVVLFIVVILPAAIGNIKFPWDVTALVPPPIELIKEVCRQEANAPECGVFQRTLTLPKGATGETYQVRWRVSVKNTSGEELKGATISDDHCSIGKLDLAPGDEKIFSCPATTVIPADKDDVVTNIATFVADPSEPSPGVVIPARFQRTAASVIVGSPEIGCFDFSRISDSGERSLVMAEASRLASFAPAYTAFLCAGGTVQLFRDVGSAGSAVIGGNQIHLGDAAFQFRDYLFYALAHESGHVYAHRNGRVFSIYCSTVFGKNCPLLLAVGPGAGEGYIRTYPADLSHCLGRCPNEDFAEMIGVYIARIGNSTESVDLMAEYSKHYNFAKSAIFERRPGF